MITCNSHVFTHSLKQTMTTLGEDRDNVTRCQNLHKWKTFISGDQFWSRWALNKPAGRSYFKQYENKNKVHLWASENHPFGLVCSWRKYLSVWKPGPVWDALTWFSDCSQPGGGQGRGGEGMRGGACPGWEHPGIGRMEMVSWQPTSDLSCLCRHALLHKFQWHMVEGFWRRLNFLFNSHKYSLPWE